MADKEYDLWCAVYLKAMDLVAEYGENPDCPPPYKAAGKAVLYFRAFYNSIDEWEQRTAK